MVVQLNSTFSGTLPPGAHVGVTCDGCRGPICGVRHKCSFCPDYDLCTQCKQNGIHNHHMMHEIQHNPHSNTSTQYPAYPQAPTQYPAYPNNPTQYPAYPQTPNQYPVYPQTPTQYPSYPQTPTQYPAQPQTPNQYPSYPQTPTQYPAHPQTNTQYPAYPQTPTQHNGYASQYSQSNPNQYSQPSQSSQPSQTGPHAVHNVSQPIQSSHSAQSFTQCHVTHSSRPHHHGPHHGRHHRNHGNVIHGNVFHPHPRHPFHPGHTISGSQFPPVNTSQVQTLMQQMTLSNGAAPPTQPSSFNSSSSSGQYLSTAKWTPLQAGAPFNRIPLQSSDPEYQAVIQNMNNNGGQAWTSKVITICRIENYRLFSIYKSCRDDMEREHGPGFQNERTLWHGTSADVLGNIYRGGFNRSYCGKNGTAIGNGVYFASAFSLSAGGYSPPDKNGQKYVFQCRVLTGHFTPGKSGMKEPPMRTPELRYDSVVDQTASPSMFVVFKDMQVYPEYVITFKA